MANPTPESTSESTCHIEMINVAVPNGLEKNKSEATNAETVANGSVESTFGSKWFVKTGKSLIDGFKREEPYFSTIDPETQSEVDEVAEKTGISSRHVSLIALAGGLGTGLLVGTGKALKDGGPGGLIISYIVIGLLLFCTMSSGSELAVAYPDVVGGFNAYASFLVDQSLGFAVSWNYEINWLTVLPLEMVTASMTIKFWNDTVNPCVFVSVFFTFVVAINMFGSKGYAEAEFWFNTVKLGMLLGFLIFGMIVDLGGAGSQGFIGAKYFHNPGSFPNGFKGLCATLVTAAFSLGGTEFMVLTAADQKNPSKAIPKAIKLVGYRLVVFYLGSMIILSLVVASNNTSLMGSGHNNGAPVSPFVIAVSMAGIRALAHIINAVILISVISVGNSAFYSSSRTLHSLAIQKQAPQWFNYVDKKGRPLRCMLVSGIVGLFSFIAAYENQESIFTWLLSLSGLATIFTWMIINISYLRFRAALEAQSRLQELGYRSSLGVYGATFAIVGFIFILSVQFWISLYPIGGDGKPNAKHFFQNYLGFFSIIILYVCHKLYTKNWNWLIPASEIDLNNQRKIFEVDIVEQEKLEAKQAFNALPFHKKVLDFIF